MGDDDFEATLKQIEEEAITIFCQTADWEELLK